MSYNLEKKKKEKETEEMRIITKEIREITEEEKLEGEVQNTLQLLLPREKHTN